MNDLTERADQHPQHAGSPDGEARFRRLYESTYDDLLRFVQRRVHPDHAEDVTAETFMAAWRRLHLLPNDHGDSRAWLFGIARNLLLNEQRGTARRRALGVRLAQPSSHPPDSTNDDLGAVAAKVDLARAWTLLTEVHQEVLALVAFDDLNASQGANLLGISPVAFRLRLSRARRALRHHLEQPRADTRITAPNGARHES